MQIGAHVSIAGGVFNAPDNAKRIGAETFQIFSRSPRGGPAPVLTDEILKDFKAKMEENGFERFYIHTPYFINFASDKKRISQGSIQIVREELERGSLLGATALMTHLGSAKDLGEKQAIKKTITGLKEVLKGYKGSCKFMIENSAGSGSIIGDEFEEIAEIIKGVESIKANQGKVFVCLDTCHAHATGYDLRNKKSWQETLRQFDKLIGTERLLLIHANDSKHDLGEKKDRHDNIGQGKIGIEGFRSIFTQSKLKKVDIILETPWVDGEKTIKKDINKMKRLRDAK